MDLKSPSRDLAGLFGADLASRLIPFLVLPVLTRRLGPEAFGQFAFASAAIGFFGLAASFGIIPYATRELAQCSPEERGSVVRSIVRLRWIGGISAFLVLLLVVRFFPLPLGTRRLLAIQGFGLLLAPFDLGWIFLAIGGVRRVAYANLVGQSVAAVSALILVKSPRDVSVYVATGVIASVITIAVSYGFVRRVEPWALRQGGKRAVPYRQILSEAGLLGLASLGSLVYNRADAVLLGFMVSASALGAYAAAYKLYELGLSAVLLASQAYFPHLARAAREEEGLTETAANYVKVAGTVAMAGTAATLAVAPEAIGLIFGQGYRVGGNALRILALAFPLGALASLGAAAFLMAARRSGRYASVVLMSGAINLLLNVLLIPRYGIQAAASTTVLSQAFVALLAIAWRPLGVGLRFLKPLVPAAAGAALLFAILMPCRKIVPEGQAGSIAICVTATLGCTAMVAAMAFQERQSRETGVI